MNIPHHHCTRGRRYGGDTTLPLVTLTELTLRNLKTPEKDYVLYIDKALKGFSVRVTSQGKKTFVITYGKKGDRKRHTIGDVGVVPLKDARDKAKDLLAGYQLDGHDNKPPAKTFTEALDLFIASHLKQNNRQSSARETERLLRRHFLPKLKAKRLDQIRKSDLLELVDKLRDTPAEANHAFTAAKTMWKWLASRDMAPDVLGGSKLPFTPRSRDRVFSEPELAAVLTAARDGGMFGKLIELLILTGQRVGQFAPDFTGTVDSATVRWAAGTMKANYEHIIPLTDRAKELLDELIRQNGFSKSKKAFDEKVRVDEKPIPNWTIHDLRRVFSTYNAGKLRVPPHIVEGILAHRTGVISGVAAIYNRWDYLDEQRACLVQWEAYLATLLKN
jgi:integrase